MAQEYKALQSQQLQLPYQPTVGDIQIRKKPNSRSFKKFFVKLASVLLPFIRQDSKTIILFNKKNLKNVGPIRHNEPPHADSPDVASGTVARRLRIDVHDNDDNDNAW